MTLSCEETVHELEQMLHRFTEAAGAAQTVLHIEGGYVYLSSPQGGIHSALKPHNMKVQPGMQAVLEPETGQIARVIPNTVAVGSTATVIDTTEEHTATVSLGGEERIVYKGNTDCQPGDIIVLDLTNLVICEIKKRPEQKGKSPTVAWEDIGGQEEAKQVLQQAILWPQQYPELFEAYGLEPAKGVLLYGPPGCGKTLLAKAVATSITEGTAGFLYMKGPEVLDPYVGVAEETIRRNFMQARRHYEETGNRSVLFIDEAEAILGTRGGHHAHMEKTIVPQFLTEMDGLEESRALVILSTNRPSDLDPAIVRDGRIDHKVNVARPTKEVTPLIWDIHTAKTKLIAKDLRDFVTTQLFSKTHKLFRLTYECNTKQIVYLYHIISGAMIRNLAYRCMNHAIQRDLANGGKPKGLQEHDVRTVIKQLAIENRRLDHSEVFFELAKGREITNVERY